MGGSLLRPFLLCSGVRTRSYSLPLQRKIADFGSDMAFLQVNKKLQEHYGITVPENGLRTNTLRHAQLIKEWQDARLGTLNGSAKDCVISETDGSMVPIVKTKSATDGTKSDRRKNKELVYREARLTMAHDKNSVTPIFSATLGSVKEAGRHLLHCVKAVGANEKTKVHSVGDGAVWIADQIEQQFGANANYLVDFYHLCEYLSAAAKSCAPNNEKAWLKQQKEHLKESRIAEVMSALKPYVESRAIPEEHAPVRACYRYMNNRLNQLDYKSALDKELPIGSGEIESAHRYVIQKRLKIAGAWWLEHNAEVMLALRVNRANNDWDSYWKSKAA